MDIFRRTLGAFRANRIAAGASAAFLMTLAASSAYAQVEQICLALNEGGSGSEYLSVSPDGGLEANSAYTIEAWVFPVSWTGLPTIVGNDYTVSYWLGLSTTGRVRFYPRGGDLNYVESVHVVPLDTWTHVAAVYNSASGWSIYLNGVLDASGASPTGAPGTGAGDLRIGADRFGGSPAYFWHGYLDEIRIWSSARTGTEIRETLFTGPGRVSAFTNGYYNALRACWTVENPFTTGIPDRSGDATYNFGGFVNGDYATETTFDDPFGPPVAPNVGLQLNGVDDRVVLPVSENFVRGVTVSAWIAPTRNSNFPTIVGRYFVTSFWLGVTSTGVLRFYPRGGTYLDGTTQIPLNRWTHVAATYDGSRTVLYVNGRVDRVSTAITGAVGANGRDVWIGADNEPGGPAYLFQGYLDEVQVVQGALSMADVREHMFVGYPGFSSSFMVPDQAGVSVTLYHESFDLLETIHTILGTGARITRGGTAAMHPFMPIAGFGVSGYAYNGVGGWALPDDDVSSIITAVLTVTAPLTVSQVEVFLSSALNDLSDTQITLRSPAGTVRNLLTRGEARGRDLFTVISDSATETWASGSSPYTTGVQPSETLSAFSGQSAAGSWRIELNGGAFATRVGLWACGLRFNELRTDVAAGAEPGANGAPALLRFAGPNPARDATALAFNLVGAARVDLGLFDVKGREVRRILSGEQQPGSFVMNISTEGLPTGVYFASLRVDGEARGAVKLSVVR